MTKSQMKFVAESYAKYFGRAADADTIKEYGLKENGKAEKESVILENIIADADVEKGQIDPANFVNNAFQNLFGRNATTKEMSKYYKVVDAGKDLPINSIVKSAAKTDKAVYNNKMAVAVKYAELGGKGDLDLSKISKGNTVDLNKVFTLTDLTNAIGNLADNSGIPSSFDGKTFVLTEGVDTGKDFIGTNKNDLFVADATLKITASSADTLDGGKGVDTFKVYDKAGPTVGLKTLPTLKNIENVVIYDNKTVDLDLKKWDTVETLFLVNSIDTTTGTTGIELGEKVTTVNLEDVVPAAATTQDQILIFDKALTAATLGVNKVGTGTAGAVTVTVDSATTAGALKTLTINAYGKASDVILAQAADTIETLNITGKADLTLAYSPAGTSKIATIDGSKAEGKLDLDLDNTDAATLKTVKTGSGNDTVTLGSVTGLDVASGTTINLGAGNDKLVAGAGSVVNSTTTVIDGGAGIDTLAASLVTLGNAGVFVSFETISLDAAGTSFDMDLLTKSTLTAIALDAGGNHALSNVKKSQSLTVNAAATSTILTFKASEVAGTADAYTINFDKETSGVTFDAGIVTIAGIETVTVNSLGKTSAATDTNKITLKDADAKSLVITGDKNIELVLGTAANEFGTAGASGDRKGVATIDASASTAGIKITTLANTGIAENGLTIKGGAGADSITTGATTAKALTIETGAGGDTIDLSAITVATGPKADKIIVNAGAGDDNITVGATGGTFTLGAGKDTIDVKLAVADGTTVATGAIKTTITGIEKGDIIKFAAGGTFTKTDVSAATDLDSALGIASGVASGTNITWFQYAGSTYIVDNNNATAGIHATDVVVKLNGLVDLSNSSLNGGTDLTIA